ncbi:bacteriocin fulvocin C-related protein [Flavobacterium sp. XS1P32]|uniref:bacteriocin fulvocin C-related protein n=1 Tax=Flavobacterium sp. XS1P32 TaxID=3401726 RepID=UPI003AB06085
MKKIKISVLMLLVLTLFAGIFFGCTKESDSQESTINANLRESFLKNKDYSSVKNDFNLLDKKGKIELWNEKLNQLLSQELPADIKNLIKKLIVELNKKQVDPKIMSETAVSLAKSIPAEDFYKMFTELNDYRYEGKFKGNTIAPKEIITDLYSMNYDYKANEIGAEINKTTVTRACNCNWTCDSYAGGSTANCTSTTSGCGFLWAFSCERRVGPVL